MWRRSEMHGTVKPLPASPAGAPLAALALRLAWRDRLLPGTRLGWVGGPLLTAGGVAFLSGTLDHYLRAYNVTNGEQLWQARLPAGGQATPMSYTGRDGRQYVVVAAGGHGSLGTKAGDSVIAYALPAVQQR